MSQKYNQIGDTIEGEKVKGSARKWIPKGLKKHPDNQTTMFLYVTDRNSTSTVVEAGIEPKEEPLKSKTSHYHRNVDDEVIGDSLSVYVNQKKPIKTSVKSGVSGRHSATIFSTSVKTIVTVKVALANILKLEQSVLDVKELLMKIDK